MSAVQQEEQEQHQEQQQEHSQSKKDLPAKIRIATYNVLADSYVENCGLVAECSLLWKDRFPRLVEKISECNADILVLHEVDFDRLDEWTKALSQYVFAVAKKNDKICSLLGHKINQNDEKQDDDKKEAQLVCTQTTPKPIENVPGGLSALFQWPKLKNLKFQIFTGHLKSGPSERESKQRNQQLEAIKQCVKDENNVEHTFVLMDANCADISALEDDDVVFKKCCETVTTSTYKKRENAYRADKNGIKESKIDFIVQMMPAKTEKQFLSTVDASPSWTKNFMPNNTEPSDHRLLACDIVL